MQTMQRSNRFHRLNTAAAVMDLKRLVLWRQSMDPRLSTKLQNHLMLIARMRKKQGKNAAFFCESSWSSSSELVIRHGSVRTSFSPPAHKLFEAIAPQSVWMRCASRLEPSAHRARARAPRSSDLFIFCPKLKCVCRVFNVRLEWLRRNKEHWGALRH